MEKSSFFNAVNVNGTYDRTYKAEDFAAYFGTVLTSGIFPSPSTNLQVVASSDMTVTVKSGDAFINGYMYHNTDDLILELNTADGVLKRIDLVVVRLDHVNREIKCHIKTGTFGSSPVKPSLTRNEEVYELCLAEINIGNGIISVNQDSIIDTRYNSSVCGIVNSLIEIDTEEIYSQMRGLIEQREEEFFKWFNDLKVNLDGNVATNLQNQINVLEDDVLINNTSEDLLNEDVTSFKVGTGSVEGIKKDYTEQMKQSFITLDNIHGKTVKDGTILKDITINIDGVNYCILRSLPNGVFDEIKDGNLIQRVGIKVFDGSENFLQAGDSAGRNQFFIERCLENLKWNASTVDFFETGGHFTQYWIKKSTNEGETYNGECIRLFKDGHIYFKINKNGVSDSIADFKASLNANPLTVIYELEKPIITPINVSILTNSNDNIYIDTPIPLTCTHKVSLNTKSQVEELQEVVQKEKKSVLQNFKELKEKVGFKAQLIGETGYIKFPSILGGILIQWGTATQQVNSNRLKVVLPISYNTRMINTLITGRWFNSSNHFWTLGMSDNHTYFEAVKNGYLEVSDGIYWITIGS